MVVVAVVAGIAAVALLGWLLNAFTHPAGLHKGWIALAALACVGVAAWAVLVQDDGSGAEDAVRPSSLVGGCAPFQLFAQDEYPAYGASARAQPDKLAEKVASFDANEIIAVDGWIEGQPAYPNNPAPLNSGVWFHLADGRGWVGFAAVRSNVGRPDPDPHGTGSFLAPLDRECEGTVR